MAAAGQSQPEFDQPIITPFVVPTVLASLLAVLRHPTSWPDAVAFVQRFTIRITDLRRESNAPNCFVT